MQLKMTKILHLQRSQTMDRPKSVDELVNIISSFDAAVVTRLHSSIIAYSFDIPTIGLVWNNKQLMFGKAIKHSERFIEESFDEKSLQINQEGALGR